MKQRLVLRGITLLVILACSFIPIASGRSAIQTTPPRGPNGRPVSLEPPPLETDLVLLTVSVTSKGSAVTGLGQSRFQVFEDGVEQKLSYFWVDNRPISIGFILDASNNMTSVDGPTIRGAGTAFLKTKLADDEYFVIEFFDAPTMIVSYTTNARLMPRVYPTNGESPLYDAIYNGLDAIKEAANSRKALLVITVGGNNNKGVTDDQLVSYAIKQPVQIYSLMIGTTFSQQALHDSNVLDELAGVSGGKASFVTDSSNAMDAACAELAQALKTQYLIGYKSTNTAKDGKRRGVKVKVSSPEGSPKLTVWTRSGYYASKERAIKTTSVNEK